MLRVLSLCVAVGPTCSRLALAAGTRAAPATRSLEIGEVGEVLRALRPGVEVTDWSKVCTTDQLCQLVEESLRLVCPRCRCRDIPRDVCLK